jgi:hypothetical protein
MNGVVALGAPVQILPSRPNSWLCASRKTAMPMVNLKEMPLEAIYNSRHQLKQPCKTEMPVVNLKEIPLEANRQI